VLLRDEEPLEHQRQIVNEQQQSNGERCGRARLQGEAAEALLVLQFIKHVVGGCLPAVQFLDLRGIAGGRQVRHLAGKLVLVAVPKLGVFWPADHAQ
jgi:hypothetical protein